MQVLRGRGGGLRLRAVGRRDQQAAHYHPTQAQEARRVRLLLDTYRQIVELRHLVITWSG
jgi:hypothetical protein